MNNRLCESFLRHLDCDLGTAPLPVADWLSTLGLPTELHYLLQSRWLKNDDYITSVNVLSAGSMMADEFTPTLLPHKLLYAGSAGNGDFFVIDFSTEACVPGFITHEQWSPWVDEPEDPRKYLLPISRTLESYLYRAADRRYLPQDYYETHEYQEFLARERGSEFGIAYYDR